MHNPCPQCTRTFLRLSVRDRAFQWVRVHTTENGTYQDEVVYTQPRYQESEMVECVCCGYTPPEGEDWPTDIPDAGA